MGHWLVGLGWGWVGLGWLGACLFVLDLAQTVFPGANKMKCFLLVIADLFTLYLWCVPLPNKSGGAVLAGFKSVIEESGGGRVPSSIHSDKGNATTYLLQLQHLPLLHSVCLFQAQNSLRSAAPHTVPWYS